VQVALTATVVGPEKEDICVDEQGRIKVEFHWDRAGRKSGESSCWIRTMQAGFAWGHQFIPRVGMSRDHLRGQVRTSRWYSGL
jgi:type VI secretion system secreted protein VgrG